MNRRYLEDAEANLAFGPRDMILNGLVNYLSVTILRPVCLPHNPVLDFEAIDFDWF